MVCQKTRTQLDMRHAARLVPSVRYSRKTSDKLSRDIWWNSKDAVQKGMSSTHHLPHGKPRHVLSANVGAFDPADLPLTVREAAVYLGVSIQTVYLWVERKQIPHLRVMGRNIRFLKSDLEPFRANFRQEVGY